MDKNNNKTHQLTYPNSVKNYSHFSNLNKSPEQQDLEIERSLYYLGRALYRYSLLKTKKGEK